MAYPDQLLASDEEVVRHLHPHWITLLGPTMVFLVVAGGAGYGIAVLPAGSVQQWLRLAILVVAVVLLVAFVLAPLLRWASTHYVITTHRVMFRIGVLNRHGKDIAYPRITDVAYAQTLWDRIIGAGTLTVESAGEGPPQVLGNIPHSDQVQQLINHLVEEDQTRRSRAAGRYYRASDDGYGQVDLEREQTRQLGPPD